MISSYSPEGTGKKRVLAVGGSNPRVGLSLFRTTPPWDVLTKPTLAGEDLAQYEVVIVLNKDQLDDLSETLLENTRTPVIYATSERMSPHERQKMVCSNNLFEIVGRENVGPAVSRAMAAGDALALYRRLSHNAEEALSGQDPPKFIGALETAIREAEQHRALQRFYGDRSEQVREAWEDYIYPMMVEFNDAKGERKQEIGEELAPEVARFLEMHRVPGIERVVLDLQEVGKGEGPIARIGQDRQRHAIKVIRDKRGIDAGTLARQFVLDTRVMNEIRGFKMPEVLDPLCFEDYDNVEREDAFLVMEYVTGTSLRRVLDILNRGFASKQTSRRKIQKLRVKLVRKFLDDCITWQQNAPELLAGEEMLLSDGTYAESLSHYFVDRISDLPDVMTRVTTSNFEDLEAKVYRQAATLFENIDASPELLARGRDAKPANAVIALPKDEPNSRELVDRFFKRRSIDSRLLSRSFYNIDPKLYRMEHVLEPVARILTSLRTRFMLFKLKGAGGQGRLKKEETIKRMYAERDLYVRRAGLQGVADDNLDFAMLVAYRSFRELHSRVRQWERTRESAPSILPALYDTRRRGIVKHVQHQYVLLRGLLKEVSDLIIKDQPSASVMPDGMLLPKGALSSENAQAHLDLMEATEGSSAYGVARANALRSTILKIKEAYASNQRPEDFLINGAYH